ncbi:cobalamin biosynthesis protein [Acuticoccus sp. MNP-M23]|uniref:cobalamin biosynthesis protein n=1 Tax=Acuticoccus sp. MNP-M23 TaxID=3072793 RepID=UPI002814B639|nr:cobalamin biosynthesis protein [Acuticoccus sp. MNP-M23]WMS43281.1 cobalamin biosynthesis protein [Acuticoccus sp. MNP-M23]
MSGSIIAGWGFASNALSTEFLYAIDKALTDYRVNRSTLIQIAIPAGKSDRAALIAADRLKLPLFAISHEALAAVEADLATWSDRSIAATGSPSACEAAALCGAGEGAVLLGPRVAFGKVTCALARRR